MMSTTLTRPVVAALFAVGMLAATASAAPPPKCFVKVNSGKVFAGNGRLLARRLANASPGDTIHVGGFCPGNYVIATDLSLVGDLTADDTFLFGRSAGTVVTIASGAAVTITDLLVNGGSAFQGGGIVNEGDLTLGSGALVLGNNEGGGVFNSGTLTMTGDAAISVNFSFGSGAGLYNTGTATIGGSASIHSNTSATGPVATLGGGIFNEGSLILRDDAIVRNNFASDGGGIFNDGNLTLEDHASVTDNVATADAGGIAVGGNGIVTVDPAWAGSTCSPANSPNDYDASNGGAACP